MDWDRALEYVFIALTAMGGGVGLTRLFYVRNTNKSIEAVSGKTTFEASAIFSDSILKMLQSAQVSADRASKQAEEAWTEARRCKDELAFLRRWIIEQGLIPPVPPSESKLGQGSM